MNTHLPIRVGLMDQDFFALKWLSNLLTRDIRTSLCFETETTTELLNALQEFRDIDIVLLDVDDHPTNMYMAELILAIREIHSIVVIVCLSQQASPETLRIAVTCGTRGYLIKNEIRMAICSAVVQAMQVDFLASPGILPLIRKDFNDFSGKVTTINPWLPNPNLSPMLRQVFLHRILYGMSAPQTAQAIHLTTATVEKYMQYVYQKLSISWGDEQYLAGLNMDELSPELRSFYRFNLPPKHILE
jgi:DNA-binding NarL/FixJ family response regulator